MSNEPSPRDPELDALTSALEDGLQSCRSVVKHYREMLAAEQRPNLDEPRAVADDDETNLFGRGGDGRG